MEAPRGRFKKNRAKLHSWADNGPRPAGWFQVGFYGSKTGRRQEEVEGGNKKAIKKKGDQPSYR